MHVFLQRRKVNPSSSKRRILIIDDHDFFAACLRAMLDNESDLVVCDIMTNSQDLRERIERLKPDLLVVDLSLGAESGLEIGQRLRTMQISTPILFVSSMTAPTQDQLAAVPHAAFIAKTKTPGEFLTALRTILAPPATKASMTLGLARAQAKA
jgi:DNA-binding NarL/FixJ family response regulator